VRILGRHNDAEEQRMLEWSVGQYDSGVGAELYLPADEEGFRAVLNTFAHELTHQWLKERCPLYAPGEGAATVDQGGHFVIEGFATMVEEMSFDLARRTWKFDPSAKSLDTVASLPRTALFPWVKFIAFDGEDFRKLSHENVIPLRRRRSLGGESTMSQGHVFYEQAAAICHCLFQADGGKFRQAFLEYTAAHYAGRTPKIEDAFGMSEEELGRRVLEFAGAPSGK
jgi:hypothetical protein